MEIKNLDCNILDMLGDDWERSKTGGPFEVNRIYSAFSDIPQENVASAIRTLIERSLVTEHANGQSLSLTRAGIAEIESLRSCLKDFPERLYRNMAGCCV